MSVVCDKGILLPVADLGDLRCPSRMCIATALTVRVRKFEHRVGRGEFAFSRAAYNAPNLHAPNAPIFKSEPLPHMASSNHARPYRGAGHPIAATSAGTDDDAKRW